MKKFLAAIISLLILMTATAFANESYIGNVTSMKFHYADCYFVSKMNPENKAYFDTRDEAIAIGYVPCKRCNP